MLDPRLASLIWRCVLLPVLLGAQAAANDPDPGTAHEDSHSGLTYIWIPAGKFEMGCVPGDNDCTTDELPRHSVTLTRGFWLGQTEVTVKAYQKFAKKTSRRMPPEPKETPFRTLSGRVRNVSSGFKPGPGKREDRPIVNVTWGEADAFCRSTGGRLPTEAEWEYAGRGGKSGLAYLSGSAITREEANYGSIADSDLWQYAAPVASFSPNGFGLYDMAGNVWEWCSDWLDENYYPQSPDTDPQGPESGSARAARGGSWGFGPKYLRSSVRVRAAPEDRAEDMGFRCVIETMPGSRHPQ